MALELEATINKKQYNNLSKLFKKEYKQRQYNLRKM
jgi:hypothetical protein